MAFEEDLGNDGSQPTAQDYKLSATGLVSRTLSLLASKFVQYIIIVGIASAACVIFSFVLLYARFGTIGVIGANPIGSLIEIFLLTSTPDWLFVGVTLGFGFFAFVLNAILAGAAIKFTLDEYGGPKGDIGTSFSHSMSRLLNIIIIQLLISFIVAVVITPSSIFMTRAMEMIDIVDPFNPIIPTGAIEMMMVAMGLLFVGGLVMLYVQVRFAPALAVVIDTDLSAIDSLKKSWELTSGNFLHIFVATILLGIVIILLGAVVIILTGFVVVIDSVLIALFFGALSYIFAVVLYRDLASQQDTSNLPGYVL